MKIMNSKRFIFDVNKHLGFRQSKDSDFYDIFIILETDDDHYIWRDIVRITVKDDFSDVQECINDCINNRITSLRRNGYFSHRVQFIGFQLK